ILYLCAGNKSLMEYLRVARLDEAAQEHPHLFITLLSINVIGGQFHNIRITYDEETSVVWLCHDLSYEDLSASYLDEEIRTFIQNALSFKKILKNYIAENIISDENEQHLAAENTGESELTGQQEVSHETGLLNLLDRHNNILEV
ncbi:MAG: type III secretion system chaperone, partial [Succinivibrio sp.]|nr:type III secretion system chaperone [Succinivibrio sp.]